MTVAQVLAVAAATVFVASAAHAADSTKFGSWSVSSDKDSMTDKVTVTAIAYFKAESGISVDCSPASPGERRIIFIHLPYLGAGNRLLTYRFDDGEPVSGPWTYTLQGAVLRGPAAERFTAALAGAKRLRARASTISSEPVDADFDIAGADGALAELTKLCSAAPG